MERSSRQVPAPFNLLASPEGMVRGRSPQRYVEGLSLRIGCQWGARLGRVIHRCELLPRKKRGPAVGKTKRGKGTKCMVVVDGKGLPLGSHTDSASPAEVRLAEKTLQQIKVPKKGPGRPRTRPKRVIGDKAYDSDPLRKRLRKRGINLLSPHRRNHRNYNRQDDRLWDRYRRRYTVERTFSWFGNFRRIVVRYEHQVCMYEAFIQIACIMIVIKRL